MQITHKDVGEYINHIGHERRSSDWWEKNMTKKYQALSTAYFLSNNLEECIKMANEFLSMQHEIDKNLSINN